MKILPSQLTETAKRLQKHWLPQGLEIFDASSAASQKCPPENAIKGDGAGSPGKSSATVSRDSFGPSPIDICKYPPPWTMMFLQNLNQVIPTWFSGLDHQQYGMDFPQMARYFPEVFLVIQMILWGKEVCVL